MRTCLKTVFGYYLLAFAAALTFLANCSADDLAIGHFGSANYGDWKLTGTAFKLGPAADNQLTKLGIENARDNQRQYHDDPRNQRPSVRNVYQRLRRILKCRRRRRAVGRGRLRGNDDGRICAHPWRLLFSRVSKNWPNAAA